MIDQFVSYFDIFDGLSLDEWLGEDEKYQKTRDLCYDVWMSASTFYIQSMVMIRGGAQSTTDRMIVES